MAGSSVMARAPRWRSSLGNLFVLLLGLAGGFGVPQAQGATTSCSPSPPLPESQRKFHPGHYISIGPAELKGGLDATLRRSLGPEIRGVQLRYRWVDLERNEGEYDFSPIARDLAIAARWKLQLIAVIEDKSFIDQPPTPAYLQASHTLRSRRGYTAMRWDPYVNERLERMVASIGAQFDCDPNFEGLAFQESAPSVDVGPMMAAGYTPEKYRDSLIALMRSASQSLPRSRVFWYMNFLPGRQDYIGDVAKALIGTGVVMGGPDVLPDNKSLVRKTYPFYDAFHGRMKLFCAMQPNSYRAPRADASGYWSMEDLFVFARDRLHVDYLLWEYRSRPKPPDSRTWEEAREVMVRNPTLDGSRS